MPSLLDEVYLISVALLAVHPVHTVWQAVMSIPEAVVSFCAKVLARRQAWHKALCRALLAYQEQATYVLVVQDAWLRSFP